MQTSTGPIPKDAAAVILLRHNTNHQDPEVFLVKRSEEHTSELQSRSDLVCRLLLDKKNAVAPIPYQVPAAHELLEGKELDDALAGQAADLILKSAEPLPHNAYKLPISHALIRRALN